MREVLEAHSLISLIYKCCWKLVVPSSSILLG